MLSEFCLFEFGSTSLKFYYHLSERNEVQLRGPEIKKYLVPWTIGREVCRDGYISGSSMLRAVGALKRIFAGFVSTSRPGETVAFATGVFRDAKNSTEFIRLLADEVGLHVHVLSAAREAALLKSVFLGTNPSFPAFVFDLGGGSFQWAHAKSEEAHQRGSLPIGAFRLLDMVDESWGHVTQATAYQIVDRFLSEVPSVQVERLTGTGGTVRALARVLRGRRKITRRSLERLESYVRRNGAPRSLPPHRQIIFLSGLMIVNRLLVATDARYLEYRDLSIGKGLLRKILPFYAAPTHEAISPETMLSSVNYSAVLSCTSMSDG
jgi:exopolyphosphatase/pppGpp-phosphohydrolase